MAIMDKVIRQLEESFLSYDLSGDQEKRLINVVQVGMDESLVNFEKSLKIDEQLRMIACRIFSRPGIGRFCPLDHTQ